MGSDTVVATMRAALSKQGVGIVSVTATPQPWVAVAGLAQPGTKTQVVASANEDVALRWRTAMLLVLDLR